MYNLNKFIMYSARYYDMNKDSGLNETDRYVELILTYFKERWYQESHLEHLFWLLPF